MLPAETRNVFCSKQMILAMEPMHTMFETALKVKVFVYQNYIEDRMSQPWSCVTFQFGTEHLHQTHHSELLVEIQRSPPEKRCMLNPQKNIHLPTMNWTVSPIFSREGMWQKNLMLFQVTYTLGD